MGPSPDTESVCDCKVGSVVATNGLGDFDRTIGRRWTQDGTSVRSLTRTLNQRILERQLARAGIDFIEAELETIYSLVRGESVSEAARLEKRRQLERGGVDVDALEDQFVSHQTLYRHFTHCLELDYERETEDRVANSLEQIRAVQQRTTRVASDRIERLARSGELDDSDYRVIVDVTATCERCGRYHELGDLLESGGCGCRSE